MDHEELGTVAIVPTSALEGIVYQIRRPGDGSLAAYVVTNDAASDCLTCRSSACHHIDYLAAWLALARGLDGDTGNRRRRSAQP